jgi:hypothetical protein
MDRQEKIHAAAFRNALASRIRELRATKNVWAPLAPRADLRCRRDMELTELTAVTSPCSLDDLVFTAQSHGRADLGNLQVHQEARRVPYEDYTLDVVVLSFYQKISDEKYAGKIALLWDEYQRAKHAAAGRAEDYQRFLELKQVFEPS